MNWPAVLVAITILVDVAAWVFYAGSIVGAALALAAIWAVSVAYRWADWGAR